MDQFVGNGIAKNFVDFASLLTENQFQGLAVKASYTAGNGGTGFIQDFDKVTLVKMLLYREHTNGKQAGLYPQCDQERCKRLLGQRYEGAAPSGGP